MFSRVHYFILILFRYSYSRNYIKTTTLCGNLYEYFVMHITTYVLRNNAMFFAELKLKIMIVVLF